MVEVSVNADFDVPSDRLWRVVADFGNVAWIPGMGTVRVEGDGPGMTRYLPAGDKEIHERLESIDADSRTLRYTIPENIPFPVRDYQATMTVKDAGAGSRLVWSCVCEPDGISEEQAEQTVRGLYDMMIGWMRDYVKQG